MERDDEIQARVDARLAPVRAARIVAPRSLKANVLSELHRPPPPGEGLVFWRRLAVGAISISVGLAITLSVMLVHASQKAFGTPVVVRLEAADLDAANVAFLEVSLPDGV